MVKALPRFRMVPPANFPTIPMELLWSLFLSSFLSHCLPLSWDPPVTPNFLRFLTATSCALMHIGHVPSASKECLWRASPLLFTHCGAGAIYLCFSELAQVPSLQDTFSDTAPSLAPPSSTGLGISPMCFPLCFCYPNTLILSLSLSHFSTTIKWWILT